MNVVDILLTTFPEYGSQNVGDKLISDSAIKLVQVKCPSYKPLVVFRETPLENFDNMVLRSILAPGFSINDESYPNLFSLYKDLNRLTNFFPVGCSFQNLKPNKETYDKYRYSKSTISLLNKITQISGSIPCRDELIVGMLERHAIQAVYSGDLGLYDHVKIGTELQPPRELESIVFTIQHKAKFIPQSLELLASIKSQFPNAKLYVAHHSKPNPTSIQVSDFAKKLGFTEINLSNDINCLDFYDSIDFHIGYRLHGHISFLRRRKPSCLLIEDSRSYGIANTGSLGIGCFSTLNTKDLSIDYTAPLAVMKFVTQQLNSQFHDYLRVFQFIDSSYREFIRPYFDAFCQKLR